MTGEVVNAIGSLGFPIVCCGALFWMMNNTLKEFRNSLDKLTEAVCKLSEEQ